MGCRFLDAYYTVFSPEKRYVVYQALAGAYNCPYCKIIHRLDKEEIHAERAEIQPQ